MKGGRHKSKKLPRRYAPGYSPEELSREPIDATCALCGGVLLLYHDGGYCTVCSPPGLQAFLAARHNHWRVANGHIPMEEF